MWYLVKFGQTFSWAYFTFQLYHVTTEPTCPIWTGSSVVEQMPAKGMVVSSSLTTSLGFSTNLPTMSTPPRVKHIFHLTRFNSLESIITIHSIDNLAWYNKIIFFIHTTITALALSSLKSRPSDTFPRHTANRRAPVANGSKLLSKKILREIHLDSLQQEKLRILLMDNQFKNLFGQTSFLFGFRCYWFVIAF